MKGDTQQLLHRVTPTLSTPLSIHDKFCGTFHNFKIALRISVAVVVAFLICWAPFHTQRLMSIYLPGNAIVAPKRDTSETIVAMNLNETKLKPTSATDHWSPANTFESVLYYVSGVLYYVSAVINPILYNIMSLKFRQSFRATVLRPCACWASERKRRILDGQARRKHASIIQTYRFHSRQPGDAGNNTNIS